MSPANFESMESLPVRENVRTTAEASFAFTSMNLDDFQPRISIQECQKSKVEDSFNFSTVDFSTGLHHPSATLGPCKNDQSYFFTSGNFESSNCLQNGMEGFWDKDGYSHASIVTHQEYSVSRILKRERATDLNESLPFVGDYHDSQYQHVRDDPMAERIQESPTKGNSEPVRDRKKDQHTPMSPQTKHGLSLRADLHPSHSLRPHPRRVPGVEILRLPAHYSPMKSLYEADDTESHGDD